MDFNTSNVEQAVKQFYCNTSLQNEVHQWLTSAQISLSAWSFSWEILSTDKSVEVQFFGASTLHVKISRYLYEVPADQYESLKSRLLGKIVEFGTGPKMVLTRLCVALSSLALHMMSDHWANPIQSLISMFQSDIPNLDNVQRCCLLLELLTVLPEEFFSANLAQPKRTHLRNELSAGLSDVLPLLRTLMSPQSPARVYEQALHCFSSWVEFGVPIMDGESVILQVFQSLDNSDLFETAVDALVSVFSHPDSHRFPYTIQKLLPQVLSLQEKLKVSLEQSDMDTVQGINQIVISVAENHTKLILDAAVGQKEQDRRNVINLVQMVLQSVTLPGHYPVDEMSSNLSFTFWYILQDDMMASDPEKSHLLLTIFHPVYFSLIENLLIKVQYPTDRDYESWNAEEKEQFRCYRQDIGDTMMYAFNILREPLLGHLCSVLARGIETDVQWQLIEAIFFLFGSVADNIEFEEKVYLPTLINLVPRIPFNNIKLISTALYMIGSFGEWMNCHPECLGAVIPLMLQGLGNAEVATAATMALKDVTRENLDHIRPYVSQILAASQSALDSNILKSKECIRLMSCVGQVLSVLPFNEIMQFINRILTPHVQQLEQLVKEEPSATVKNGIILKVNMLSWLFATLDTDRETGDDDENASPKPKSIEPKPVFVIMQQVLPLINVLVSKWLNDVGVIEIVCDMLKRVLRTLMDDFAPMLQDISQMVDQMYRSCPQASLLDLVRQLVLMFHEHPTFAPLVKHLLNSVCCKTLELLQTGVQTHTDIVEGFMTLLAQILKKLKHLIADGSIDIPALFHAGVIALGVPEHHTVKAACSFLVEFLSVGTEVQVVKQVVDSEGHLLVDRILRAIGGESPRGVMDSMADVLLALSKYHFEQLAKWLNEVATKDGYPNVRVSKVDKEQFVKAILRERVNKRKIRDTVKEFTLLCRGLLGTEYAAQAAAIV